MKLLSEILDIFEINEHLIIKRLSFDMVAYLDFRQ